MEVQVKARYVYPKGYVVLYLDDGRRIEEHRWVMMQHLGRALLPAEHVHHKDGNKHNNDIANLDVLDEREHHQHHAQQRPRTAPTRIVNCAFCGAPREFKESHLRKCAKRSGQTDFYCNRRCMAKHFGAGRPKPHSPT